MSRVIVNPCVPVGDNTKRVQIENRSATRVGLVSQWKELLELRIPLINPIPVSIRTYVLPFQVLVTAVFCNNLEFLLTREVISDVVIEELMRPLLLRIFCEQRNRDWSATAGAEYLSTFIPRELT